MSKSYLHIDSAVKKKKVNLRDYESAAFSFRVLSQNQRTFGVRRPFIKNGVALDVIAQSARFDMRDTPAKSSWIPALLGIALGEQGT